MNAPGDFGIVSGYLFDCLAIFVQAIDAKPRGLSFDASSFVFESARMFWHFAGSFGAGEVLWRVPNSCDSYRGINSISDYCVFRRHSQFSFIAGSNSAKDNMIYAYYYEIDFFKKKAIHRRGAEETMKYER